MILQDKVVVVAGFGPGLGASLARRALADASVEPVEVRPGDMVLATDPTTGRTEPQPVTDVIVGDAFGSRAVPWHLATKEFMVDVARVLRPGGLYVANIIDGPDQSLLRAVAAPVVAGHRGPVDVGAVGGVSAQGADLAPAHAADHHDPQEGAPVGVAPGSADAVPAIETR